jgi:hypothetical protein
VYQITDGSVQGIAKMPEHLLLEIHSQSESGSYLIWVRIGFTNYVIHFNDILTWSASYGGFDNNVAWLASEERDIPVLLWFLGVESQMRLS